jgi:hypothetical protein
LGGTVIVIMYVRKGPLKPLGAVPRLVAMDTV